MHPFGLLMIETCALQEPLFAARVIYDLLFFFMVIIIVLNLIFGVIIDTFADLRSEKQKKEEILKTTCFICGKCRETLQRQSQPQREQESGISACSYLAFLSCCSQEPGSRRAWGMLAQLPFSLNPSACSSCASKKSFLLEHEGFLEAVFWGFFSIQGCRTLSSTCGRVCSPLPHQ